MINYPQDPNIQQDAYNRAYVPGVTGLSPPRPDDVPEPDMTEPQAYINSDNTIAADKAPEVENHLRTWHGFSHMIRWFGVHVVAIVIAVYFTFYLGNYLLGGLFFLLGFGILAGAVLTLPAVYERHNYTH